MHNKISSGGRKLMIGALILIVWFIIAVFVGTFIQLNHENSWITVLNLDKTVYFKQKRFYLHDNFSKIDGLEIIIPVFWFVSIPIFLLIILFRFLVFSPYILISKALEDKDKISS